MNPAGTTRTRVTRNHAFIAPDSHVTTSLPGWENTKGVILISPQMGARFQQYIAHLGAESVSRGAPAGVERFIYVLDGQVELNLNKKKSALSMGHFAFIPADVPHEISTLQAAKILVFEKKYQGSGVAKPQAVIGRESDVPEAPFLGDPDAVLKVLLPEELAFDWAINVFTYKPGATLPFVEVHVMEHGLLMLEGQGVYRLDEQWYPIQAGDVIWMGPYCAQWFVASGKTPSRYIYYKDMHRDAMENS